MSTDAAGRRDCASIGPKADPTLDPKDHTRPERRMADKEKDSLTAAPETEKPKTAKSKKKKAAKKAAGKKQTKRAGQAKPGGRKRAASRCEELARTISAFPRRHRIDCVVVLSCGPLL